MLMAIDVGNTNITIGFYDGDDLVATKRASTAERRTSDEIAVLLYAFMDLAQILPDQIDAVIVSSVVPKIMHSLKNAIVKYLHLEPLIVGPGIRTGISVQLDNPRSVGADRIADCAGAYHTYGGPILVVDFGTATTYDYVDADGVFRAGAISVGIESGANALWGRTAQLPEVEIRKPETILARNTATEMQAGIFFQFLGGFETTVKQYRRELKTDFRVVATGGLGRVICGATDMIDVYDPDLTFKGLKTIYDKNQD